VPVPDVARLLTELARALKVGAHRWYVFGAQAVIAAGVPRATADIDITVESADTVGLVSRLKKAGFALRPEAADPSFVRVTRVLPFQHTRTGYGLDVVLAGPGLEEQFLGRVRRRRIGRALVPFIDTNDLLVLKVLAGRPKDLEDVGALLRTGSNEIQVSTVRTQLADVERLIDDSTLVARFDELVAANGRRRPRRPSC